MCFCVISNTLLVFGGRNSDMCPSSQCHALSLTTLKWSKMPDLPTARSSASAAVLGTDKVIVLGGVEKKGDSNACEVMNVQKRIWKKLRSMREGLFKPLLTVLNSDVYILKNSDNIPTDTKLMVYHTASDTYTYTDSKLPTVVTNTWGACLVRLGAHLFLFGGQKRLSHQYSPLSDQWVQISQPHNQYDWLCDCKAVTDRDTILLCGGKDSEGECKLVEKYDTVTDQWTPSDITLPFDFWFLGSFVCLLPE